MMGGLVDFPQSICLRIHSCSHPLHFVNIISNLIKGQPVLNDAFPAGHHCFYKFCVKINHSPVFPSTILISKMKGHLIMRNGYHNFHSVFSALFKYFIVKFQSFLIWLCLFTCRIDSCPGNTCTIYLESHFSEFCNIFFIMMVKINPLMCRIVFGISIRISEYSMRLYICYGRKFSILHISPFILIGGCCSSPQKSFRESFRNLYIFTAFHVCSPPIIKFY